MEERLRVRAQAGIWHTNIEFLIQCEDFTAEPIIMKKRDIGAPINPTFKLSYNQAQILMDDLWIAGLRPTEGAGSAGAMAATQKHLEDMRRLVFGQETKLEGK